MVLALISTLTGFYSAFSGSVSPADILGLALSQVDVLTDIYSIHNYMSLHYTVMLEYQQNNTCLYLDDLADEYTEQTNNITEQRTFEICDDKAYGEVLKRLGKKPCDLEVDMGYTLRTTDLYALQGIYGHDGTCSGASMYTCIDGRCASGLENETLQLYLSDGDVDETRAWHFGTQGCGSSTGLLSLASKNESQPHYVDTTCDHCPKWNSASEGDLESSRHSSLVELSCARDRSAPCLCGEITSEFLVFAYLTILFAIIFPTVQSTIVLLTFKILPLGKKDEDEEERRERYEWLVVNSHHPRDYFEVVPAIAWIYTKFLFLLIGLAPWYYIVMVRNMYANSPSVLGRRWVYAPLIALHAASAMTNPEDLLSRVESGEIVSTGIIMPTSVHELSFVRTMNYLEIQWSLIMGVYTIFSLPSTASTVETVGVLASVGSS
eukprot:725543-Pyramimonas_sp.AAC.1